MKYETAAQIGLDCGLDEPAEFVNNIVLHAMNLFAYSDIRSEIDELRQTAIEQGVRFSTICGDAILVNDKIDEPCYICRKINGVL